MLEKHLIDHCSPTLAGLKMGNLVSIRFENKEAFCQEVAGWDALFSGKGVRLCLLRLRENCGLVYVYRPIALARRLLNPGFAAFLHRHGYENLSVEAALQRLRSHINEKCEFPHEIGVFLGYPLEDIEGFIRHRGKCCKCCGCWKVYGDEDAAKRTFRKFDLCTAAYRQLFASGHSLLRLTVTA